MSYKNVHNINSHNIYHTVVCYVTTDNPAQKTMKMKRGMFARRPKQKK